MKRLSCALVIAVLAGATTRAADLAPLPYRAPPPVVVPASTWTGFHVGGNIGGAGTSVNELWSPTFAVSPILGSTGGVSFAGGLQAGYDWQFAPTWVAGVEADWSWASARGSINQPWSLYPSGVLVPGSFTSMSSTLDWVSSVRVRLGYLVAPTLLAYATAGGAWGRFDYVASSFGPANPAPPYAASTAFSTTQGGWVAGAGLEWAMTVNWLLRGEYLFYSLSGSPSLSVPAVNYPGFPSGYAWSNTNVGIGRLGLSYKF
jgi:outer membrane immunogenic protein